MRKKYKFDEDNLKELKKSLGGRLKNIADLLDLNFKKIE